MRVGGGGGDEEWEVGSDRLMIVRVGLMGIVGVRMMSRLMSRRSRMILLMVLPMGIIMLMMLMRVVLSLLHVMTC